MKTVEVQEIKFGGALHHDTGSTPHQRGAERGGTPPLYARSVSPSGESSGGLNTDIWSSEARSESEILKSNFCEFLMICVI